MRETNDVDEQITIQFDPIYSRHICEDAAEIMVVVDFVTSLGCSLQTLFLDLPFRKPRDDDLDDDIDDFDFMLEFDCYPSYEISESITLVRAIAALNISNEITISITSNDVSDCSAFHKFARRIAQRKQWALSLDNLPEDLDCDSDLEGDGADEEQLSVESLSHGNNDEIVVQSEDNEEQESANKASIEENAEVGQDGEEGSADNASNEGDVDSDMLDAAWGSDNSDNSSDNRSGLWDPMPYSWWWKLKPPTTSTMADVPQPISRCRKRVAGRSKRS